MSALQIRSMTAADVAPAAHMYRAGEWGERERFLEWALANPAIGLWIGGLEGRIVATGMATVNGDVGWVGSIFVDEACRGRGYGRAMTERACAAIEAAGCRTQALMASPLGKPLYDSMGFRTDDEYVILAAGPLADAPGAPSGRILRPMQPADLPGVSRLDALATGENREKLIHSLAGGGWVVESEAGIGGFTLSILPDSATVIASDPGDALALLDQVRHTAGGRAPVVHAGVPASNAAGVAELEDHGWERQFQTPRMLRGEAVPWQPEMIWGILGFAFG